MCINESLFAIISPVCFHFLYLTFHFPILSIYFWWLAHTLHITFYSPILNIPPPFTSSITSSPPWPVTCFLHVWLGIGSLTVGSRQTTSPASVTAAAAAVAAAAGTTAGLVEQGSTVAHPGHATPLLPLLLLCTCFVNFSSSNSFFLLYPSLHPEHGSSEHDGWPHG